MCFFVHTKGFMLSLESAKCESKKRTKVSRFVKIVHFNLPFAHEVIGLKRIQFVFVNCPSIGSLLRLRRGFRGHLTTEGNNYPSLVSAELNQLNFASSKRCHLPCDLPFVLDLLDFVSFCPTKLRLTSRRVKRVHCSDQ